MKPEQLYSQFEGLAEQLGITLVEGRGDFEGGYCRVNDDQFIVLNKMKPLHERLRVLAKSFRQLDIRDRYVIPALRDFIEPGREDLLEAPSRH